LALIGWLVSPVSAVASPTTVAQAAAAQSTISGHVTDTQGAPVAGATISITGGSKTYTTTTAPDGSFSQSLPAGLYTVTVSHGGFQTAQNDVATTAGGTFNADVRLQGTSFESLQVIGRTTTRASNGARSTFNATPASQDVITNQVFQDNASLQMRNELNQTPGIISALPPAVNPASPGAITFPNIRGSLSFETAALIDGHPLAVSDFGDFVTTFLNPAVFGSIEVIKGPGAAAPEIQRAIGGTVNFRTLSPTAKPAGDFTYGVDSFGGSYTTLRFTDTVLNGRLGVAVVYAVDGTPGPPGSTSYKVYSLPDGFSTYTDSQGNPVSLAKPPSPSSQPNPAAQNNKNNNAVVPVLAFGALAPDTYTTHNELVKLTYRLSSASSITASYLGEQGYSDQNGNNGDYVPTNFMPGAAYAGGYPTGPASSIYKNPFGYGDEWEIDNEPIFQGEFRTSFKNDSIVARYYHAAIIRDQSNGGQFASQVSPVWNVLLYGTQSNGAPLNGLDPFGKPYTAQETSGWAFASNEEDKLSGYSFEYDHPLGDSGSLLTFTADTNHTEGHSYNPFGSETTATVPKGSTQDVTTYLLRGQFQLGPRLSSTLAYYLTDFRSHFGYGLYPNATASSSAATLAFGDQNFYHSDGRIGLEYRASRDLSLRLAAGSAVSPPYLAILSTPQKPATICGVPGQATSPACPSGVSPGTAAVASTTGGGVLPESSIGFDLGGDYRLPHDPSSVLTVDIYAENLFDQFVNTTFLNGSAAVPALGASPAGTYPLYVKGYGNLSRARYEGIEIGLNRAPAVGFGYVLQGALLRGYALGVPPGGYPGKLGIVNFANFTDQSVSNQAIPYAQGYAELNYRTASNALVLFGGTYYGPNNDFDIPATWFWSGTVRFPIHDKYTTFQVSVDNLFNTDADLFPTNFAGTQIPLVNGQYYATTLKNYGPRQFRFQISHSFAR
jgi:outer membrane receptor protein involved in Fe transport